MPKNHDTCADCGANLDHGEKCDCHQNEDIPTEDKLTIGFDFSNGKDMATLLIGRRSGRKINVLRAFYGKEALDLYRKLTGK